MEGASNPGAARLRTRKRNDDPMRAFDALPPPHIAARPVSRPGQTSH
ncbi:MAG: DUF6525 family protein [Rhodomicrobiaceae bacterium]